MAGIEANIIQEMVDQIDAFKKAVEAAGDEGRNKLKSINIDEELKEIPRTGEGKLDTAAWSKFDENKQKELYERIRLVREAIKGLLETTIDAKSIQGLEDQIEVFKKMINKAGEEGRSRLKSIKIDDVIKEIPRKDGKVDTTGWDALPEDKKQVIYDQLTFVRDALHAAAELDGPTDPKHIMHDDYASTKAVYIWTALGLVLTAILLYVIALHWGEATSYKRESPAGKEAQKTDGKQGQGASATQSEIATPETKAGKEEALEKSKTVGKEDYKTKAEVLKAKVESVSTQDKKVQQEGQKTTNTQNQNTDAKKDGATEGIVLTMVILLGALGGSLHFVSSLVKFIGNRQLKRSWLPYYLAMPFAGAGLAPIVYMLLRIGLINPSGVSSDGTAISSLNLIAIYAFAALTGMFSRVATDKLGEVFGTIFRTQTTSKDALGAQKPPGGTAPAAGKP